MAAMNITKDNFNQIIVEEKRTAVIDFWAPWCTYCRRIAPAYEKIAEQYGETLLVGKINIDEAEEVAQQYQVEVIPTLIFFKDGKPVDRVVAPDSKAKIEAFLKANLS